jgi:HAD superfamily hydrolase (TIGR01549 family)
MSSAIVDPGFQWDAIRLVVFDVDGTLYHQRSLRLRMARDLLLHAARSHDFGPVRLLARYRKVRERMGEEEVEDFEPALLAEVAAAVGTTSAEVEAVADEWMNRRPLRHLARSRFPALPELVAALRGSGKAIGVLSDYPAPAKLAVLGIEADYCVSAGDIGVGRLKPHPAGLIAVMAAAGVAPAETVMIGDRVERDGEAARRAGAHALIKADRARPGWQTFCRYDDALFAPLFVRS